MNKQIITKGNRAVVINTNDGTSYWANVYVNARNGLQGADITMISWKGKTLAGAKKWAEKQLSA